MTTDNDRMLLEKAAKAAGIELGEYWTPYLEEIHNQHWNPLRNDGQALRLAVKLKISIVLEWTDRLEANWWDDDGNYHSCGVVFDNERGMCAATRRAIVRAAAMIGESM